jgi:DNA-directed RNA polymerase subunit K/omega
VVKNGQITNITLNLNYYLKIFYILIIIMDDDNISNISEVDIDIEEGTELGISDEESDKEYSIIEDNIQNNIEDINVFNKNYELLKKNNITSIFLNKYEITKILSKRSEQLESGSIPFIKGYEKYNNVYDIALEELKHKKIPFILKRFINNKYEYWKLEDLKI